jgi:small-conductance mechanosensitive channel
MSEQFTNIGLALAILAAAIIVGQLSTFLLRLLQKRLLGRTRTKLDDLLVESIKGPLRIVIFIAGLELFLQQLDIIPANWAETAGRIFFVVYLIIVYVVLYRVVGNIAAWYGKEVVFQTETDLDDKFLSFFRHLATIIVTAIIVVLLLDRFGIEADALITTLGVGSLAIALAAQATLGDIIAGFMIMIDRPFGIGDRIELLDIDTWGDVTEVGLRSTRILTRDNRMVSIPNSVIGKGLIVNYSNPNTVYRVETHVGIAYGTDIEFARQVMIDAITAEEWVMKEKLIEALLLEFGESALVFRVRCWIEHFVETRRVIDKMNTALYKALNEANIIFATPQRTVHLKSSVTPEKVQSLVD